MPGCGGRDRFSINTTKQLFNCRGCNRGGDVIEMVQHLDGVNFKTAVRLLAGFQQTQPKPQVQPVAKPKSQEKVAREQENAARALTI